MVCHMNSDLLTVENISKAFVDGARRLQALEPVSFSLAARDFVCLLGPSGSGKSTLLRMVGGLVTPDGGRLRFDGEPYTTPRPEIGFVFQKTNLMPWRTAIQNILLPIEIQQKKVTKADLRHARELVELMGLHGFEHSYPHQLSGGMNQRVVLARTLIHKPRLLLMDEPFGALDALTRERLNVELMRLQQEQGLTILMVTHSIAEAVFLADRVLVLSERPGQLVGQVAIDLPRPRDLGVTATEAFGHLTAEVRRYIGEPGLAFGRETAREPDF